LTMENFGVAKGDIFKSFPKEIPQLSIINYQLSIINSCVSTRNGNLLGRGLQASEKVSGLLRKKATAPKVSFYLRTNRTPRVAGPQWQDTVQPAVVS